MEEGNLPIGDAVSGGQVVVLGAWRHHRLAQALLAPIERPSLLVSSECERRTGDVVGGEREGYGYALQPDHARVGRTCPSLPALRGGLFDLHAKALKLDQQPSKRRPPPGPTELIACGCGHRDPRSSARRPALELLADPSAVDLPELA